MHSDFKKGEAKVKIENLDDLWYLNQIIDSGDLVKGKTLRKIQIGQEGQRKQDSVKKSIFLPYIHFAPGYKRVPAHDGCSHKTMDSI